VRLGFPLLVPPSVVSVGGVIPRALRQPWVQVMEQESGRAWPAVSPLQLLLLNSLA